MKNNKVLLAVVALIAAVAVMLGLWMSMRPETVEGGKDITVTVIHKDTTEKVFEYHTDAEYLGEVLLSEGLAQGETGEFGLMISAVDGETADWSVDQGYWAIFIGEDYATTGADAIPLTDGGAYSLVYTIG